MRGVVEHAATVSGAGEVRAGGEAGEHVRLREVEMAFGERVVFEGLNCGFLRGKISVILGGSGSGKSTILRMIGGLLRPQRGRVEVDGENVAGMTERGLFGVRQKMGMVFQGGALLDAYSVFENLALPLRERTRMTAGEIAGEVRASLEAVGVSDVDRMLPGELSGGMLRRVALARAIIRKPVLLLCDEPFSGLDPVSIKRIEALLVGINRQYGMTVVVVSHHIPSTLRMADRVLLLVGGRAVEGTPEELLGSSDREVAEFLDEGVGQAKV